MKKNSIKFNYQKTKWTWTYEKSSLLPWKTEKRRQKACREESEISNSSGLATAAEGHYSLKQ